MDEISMVRTHLWERYAGKVAELGRMRMGQRWKALESMSVREVYDLARLKGLDDYCSGEEAAEGFREFRRDHRLFWPLSVVRKLVTGRRVHVLAEWVGFREFYST